MEMIYSSTKFLNFAKIKKVDGFMLMEKLIPIQPMRMWNMLIKSPKPSSGLRPKLGAMTPAPAEAGKSSRNAAVLKSFRFNFTNYELSSTTEDLKGVSSCISIVSLFLFWFFS